MATVLEEVYCHECKGYFRVTLNLALDYVVELICPGPGCGHKHRRCIKDGHIFEQGRDNSAVVEEILPTKAAYSKTPATQKMQELFNKTSMPRDGVPIPRPPMYDRWAEIAARERGEIE